MESAQSWPEKQYAGFCDHVALHLLPQENFDFGPQILGIFRTGADLEDELMIPVNVRRMAYLHKRLIMRHYPLEPVEVTPRENRVIKPRYHLEQYILRTLRQLPVAVVIVYIFGILVSFGHFLNSLFVLGLCFQVLGYGLAGIPVLSQRACSAVLAQFRVDPYRLKDL